MVDLGADDPYDDEDLGPGADLYKADLSGTDLSDVDLSDATLSEADLSGADLSGADLYNADLYKADFSGTDLSGATLSEANLSKTDLSDAILSSANLSNADLSNADLSGADLSDAGLSDAGLSDADLSGADFSDAHVSDADLSGADLSNTSLSHRSSGLQRVAGLIGMETVGGGRWVLSQLTDQIESISQFETGMDEQSGTVSPGVWPIVIELAIPGWLVVFLGIDFIPNPLWGIGFLAVWVGLPVALFLDARTLRETGEWPQYWWAYVLTATIWIVAVIPALVYLWRRQAHQSQSSTKQAQPSER